MQNKELIHKDLCCKAHFVIGCEHTGSLGGLCLWVWSQVSNTGRSHPWLTQQGCQYGPDKAADWSQAFWPVFVVTHSADHGEHIEMQVNTHTHKEIKYIVVLCKLSAIRLMLVLFLFSLLFSLIKQNSYS